LPSVEASIKPAQRVAGARERAALARIERRNSFPESEIPHGGRVLRPTS
jgi:hypothetical protein